MRCRIGNIHDLLRIHRALVRNLLRINPRRRRRHIHLLANNLLVRQHDLHTGLTHAVFIWASAARLGFVESRLLHGDLVQLVLLGLVPAVPRVIRPQLRRRDSRLHNCHLRAGNRCAVFIDHRQGDAHDRTLRSGSRECNPDQKKHRHGSRTMASTL